MKRSLLLLSAVSAGCSLEGIHGPDGSTGPTRPLTFSVRVQDPGPPGDDPLLSAREGTRLGREKGTSLVAALSSPQPFELTETPAATSYLLRLDPATLEPTDPPPVSFGGGSTLLALAADDEGVLLAGPITGDAADVLESWAEPETASDIQGFVGSPDTAPATWLGSSNTGVPRAVVRMGESVLVAGDYIDSLSADPGGSGTASTCGGFRGGNACFRNLFLMGLASLDATTCHAINFFVAHDGAPDGVPYSPRAIRGLAATGDLVVGVGQTDGLWAAIGAAPLFVDSAVETAGSCPSPTDQVNALRDDHTGLWVKARFSGAAFSEAGAALLGGKEEVAKHWTLSAVTIHAASDTAYACGSYDVTAGVPSARRWLLSRWNLASSTSSPETILLPGFPGDCRAITVQGDDLLLAGDASPDKPGGLVRLPMGTFDATQASPAPLQGDGTLDAVIALPDGTIAVSGTSRAGLTWDGDALLADAERRLFVARLPAWE